MTDTPSHLRARADWNDEFLANRSRVLTTARFTLRVAGLRDEALDDKLQIAEENAYKMFLAMKAHGKEPVFSALGRYGAKQAMSGRTIAGGEPRKDAMSRSAGRVTVQALPEHTDTGHDENDGIDALIDPRSDPADVAAFKLDFLDYRRRMPEPRRQVLDALLAGRDRKEICHAQRFSESRLSQLKTELEEDMAKLGEGVMPEGRGR